MEKLRETILRAAVAKYGKGPQRDKAIEELSELIRVLARCDNAENVAEEMADVRIILEQLKIIHKNHGIVDDWRAVKLGRLQRRLNEVKAGNRS